MLHVFFVASLHFIPFQFAQMACFIDVQNKSSFVSFDIDFDINIMTELKYNLTFLLHGACMLSINNY